MLANTVDYHFIDFTTDNYRALLKLAKQNYEFRPFTDFKRDDEGIVFWRHDIDFSVHRALSMAELEAEEAVQATYFLHFHNMFYNLLDEGITALVKTLLDFGHQIGLHFDCHYYGIDDLDQLEMWLSREKRLLQDLFRTEIRVFSFHRPNSRILSWVNWDYAGMINTYADYFQREVNYCSDSNGYWRHKRLQNILEERKNIRLQVLTHPGWWVQHPMSPRKRISRCIDGRAKALHRQYDQNLHKMGRCNVR